MFNRKDNIHFLMLLAAIPVGISAWFLLKQMYLYMVNRPCSDFKNAYMQYVPARCLHELIHSTEE